MTTNLEAKAREFCSVWGLSKSIRMDLDSLLRSVAAEARKEALEEAARSVACGCAHHIRALAGRKEET